MSWKKKFTIIWMGQAVSIFTSSVIQMAIIWYLTDTTKSAAVLSLATLIGFLPQAVLGPFIGVLIDRYNRKYIMIISDLGIAGVTMILVFVSSFQALPIWLIMVVLFFRSIGTGFHAPSLGAITPLIVPKEYLTNCAGYAQGIQSVSLLLSPAVAAILYANFEMSMILFTDIIGAVFAVCAMLFIKIPKKQRISNVQNNFIKEAKQGIQILRKEQGLFSLMMISSVYAMIYFPIGSLYPLISMSYFQGTFKESSIVEIAFSMGMLFGSIVLGRLGMKINKMKAIISSIAAMGLGLTITGLLDPNQFQIFVILAAFMGITIPFYYGILNAIYQTKIKEEYLGRVLSLAASLRLVVMPLGLILSGLFAEVIGVENWFLISGIITIIIALISMILPSLRSFSTEKKVL